MPNSRKQKYIIPPGTPFGGLPKKQEDTPEEIKAKRTPAEKCLEHMRHDLGLNGFHFEWGFVECIYPDLSDESVDILWSVWTSELNHRGTIIARQKSNESFRHSLWERRKWYVHALDNATKSILKENIRALESLVAASEVIGIEKPEQVVINDDLFNEFSEPSPVTEINMVELPQDIIDLSRQYMALVGQMDGRLTPEHEMQVLDTERADLHNQLEYALRDHNIDYGERGGIRSLAEMVTKWYGAF